MAGTVGANGLGFAPTPASPAKSNPPMIRPLSGPKASVYPIRAHRTDTNPRATKDCMMVPTTFFARTSPP